MNENVTGFGQKYLLQMADIKSPSGAPQGRKRSCLAHPRGLALGGHHDSASSIVDVEELSRRRARAPCPHLGIVPFLRQDAFPYQCGYHVRHGRVELVARPIEVCGHQVHDVLPPLDAVRLKGTGVSFG